MTVVTDGDVNKAATTRERRRTYTCNAVGNNYTCQCATPEECRITDAGKLAALGKCYACQCATAVEGLRTDTSDAARYHYAGEPVTVLECIFVDTGDSAWYRYACKSITVAESIFANASDATVSRYYTGFATQNQNFTLSFNDTIACTVIFGIVLMYIYAFKFTIFVEHHLTNTCDTGGDGYARKAVAPSKRLITNARHRLAIIRRRDNYLTRVAGIVGNTIGRRGTIQREYYSIIQIL